MVRNSLQPTYWDRKYPTLLLFPEAHATRIFSPQPSAVCFSKFTTTISSRTASCTIKTLAQMYISNTVENFVFLTLSKRPMTYTRSNEAYLKTTHHCFNSNTSKSGTYVYMVHQHRPRASSGPGSDYGLQRLSSCPTIVLCRKWCCNSIGLTSLLCLIISPHGSRKSFEKGTNLNW